MYNISIIGEIVLKNEMISDITLIHVWRTISSLKLYFKRGQGRLHLQSLVARQQLSCDLPKSNQISKNQ